MSSVPERQAARAAHTPLDNKTKCNGALTGGRRNLCDCAAHQFIG